MRCLTTSKFPSHPRSKKWMESNLSSDHYDRAIYANSTPRLQCDLLHDCRQLLFTCSRSTRFAYVLKVIRACLEVKILTDVQQRLALLLRDMENHNGQRVLNQPTFPRSDLIEKRIQHDGPDKIVQVRRGYEEDPDAARTRHYRPIPKIGARKS